LLYHYRLHALSQAIHPFQIGTGESQWGIDLPAHLQPHLTTLQRLSTIYAPTTSPAALECWHRKLPGWIVPHMGDLPRPRRRTLKTPKSQKPTLQAVPL
jgi:hypothetical protein